MDEMRGSELDDTISELSFTDRSLWETNRIACLISAQKASKKKLKLRDIYSLPWDGLDQSEDEMKFILEQQKQLENLLNQQ